MEQKMSSILSGMHRNLSPSVTLTAEELINNINLADDIEGTGNTDNKINVQELKYALQTHFNCTPEEATKLAEDIFNPTNNLLKTDGSLDIDKLLIYLDANADASVSTPELRTAKSSLTIGTETFPITPLLRNKALEMTNPDGSLNEANLKNWMTSNPPPPEGDIKVVVFLALKAAGYDNDTEIINNLPSLIESLRTGSTTPPTLSYTAEEFMRAIGQDADPQKVDTEKLKNVMITLGIDRQQATEYVKPLENKTVKEASDHLDDNRGHITLESILKAINPPLLDIKLLQQ